MSFTAPVSAALVIHPKSFSSSHIFLSHSVVADDVVVSRRRERSPSQRGNIVVSQRRERLRWTRRRRPSHAPMISPAPRSPTLQYPPPLLHLFQPIFYGDGGPNADADGVPKIARFHLLPLRTCDPHVSRSLLDSRQPAGQAVRERRGEERKRPARRRCFVQLPQWKMLSIFPR